MNDKNRKTNWKYLLVLILFFAAVSGIIAYEYFFVLNVTEPSASNPEIFSSDAYNHAAMNGKYLAEAFACESPAPSIIQLSKGSYYISNFPKGFEDSEASPNKYFVVTTDKRENAVGDINNDGVDDMVVFLRERCGGNGISGYLAAVTKNGDSFENVDVIALGPDHPGVESLQVKNGIIDIKLSGWNDGLYYIYKVKLMENKLRIIESSTEPMS